MKRLFLETEGILEDIEENESTNVLKMTITNFLQEEKRGSELLQVLGIPAQGNGHKTLMEVCTAQQRNEDEVIKEIERLKKEPEFDYPEGFFSWLPKHVIQYLKEEHHEYTCSLIRDAQEYGERAWEVHGIQYPKLNEVKWYVQKLKEKLETHLNFEKLEFFPMMLRLFDLNGEASNEIVETLKKQAKIIEKDQEEIKDYLQRIHDLTDDFTPPSEACTTLRMLYFTLLKLDEDLIKHYFKQEKYLLSKLK
ncbi:iron-sulfur cluster repair di-iron protein [Gracilimonas mengyeensis]|uniref:Iron-sulfur cluster repair di-iron protein n=2 Tax=Gracilimonas mengyeensis TaxID=1302730 RepID=A0A521D473_9BACT|nr:iron-sulfur cluster repair di-iron protein [Gracilimonas mengyeensis]